MVGRELENTRAGPVASCAITSPTENSLWFGTGFQHRSTDPGHGYVARPFRALVLGDAAISEWFDTTDKRLSSDPRKTAAVPMSSGVLRRPRGTWDVASAFCSWLISSER